jgi:hypothetical protein
VTVNGTLKNASGTPTSSFTTAVEVPPLKPPAPPEYAWEGDWETEWTAGGDSKYADIVTFTENGQDLSGEYEYGTMELKGSGNTLVGRWFNTSGTSGGACPYGNVKFVKNGRSFEGLWSYCGEAPKFWWRGTKLE